MPHLLFSRQTHFCNLLTKSSKKGTSKRLAFLADHYFTAMVYISLDTLATTYSPPWRNIQTSSGSTTSLIGIVICSSASGERKIWGGEAEDENVELFCGQHSASSYSRNTKGRKTTTNHQNLPLLSSITTKFD